MVCNIFFFFCRLSDSKFYVVLEHELGETSTRMEDLISSVNPGKAHRKILFKFYWGAYDQKKRNLELKASGGLKWSQYKTALHLHLTRGTF